MSSHNPFIQQLSRLDRASPQFSDQLTTLFDERNNEDHVPNLSDQDALWAVEYLDDVLDTLAPTSSAFKGCLRALELICKTWKILPKSYTLPGIPLITSSHPVVPGAIADIYEGTLNGSKVHVKQTRTYSTYSDEDMWRVQMSYQEAIMWKHARHPNIVPFLGITNTPFQLVSNWMPGGNLVGYIKENPGADRLDLLLGVAEALYYLHSRHIAHGDLKGPSILVDGAGHACLMGFGLATVTPSLEPTIPAHEYYSIRWAAPEILRGGIGISKETDIYSFGMVVIEVFGGAAPFADSTPASVMAKVLLGELPKRPNVSILTDGLWDLTRRCLDQNPRQRPETAEVVRYLRGALVVRQDHADFTDTNMDDANVGCICPWGSFYRPHCPTPPYRLWRRCDLENTPPEPGHAFDRDCSIDSKVLWNSSQRTDFGGPEIHPPVQFTPCGSHSVLRRSLLMLGCGVPSAEDYQDDMPILSAEQRPHITVDASKVGRIIYRENQLPGMTVLMNANSPSTATLTEGTAHWDGESSWKANKELTTASLLGEITTLAARLDGLCADQNPEDLSKILRIAFMERGLYNLYLTLLVGDAERTKALLEVFDKALTAPKRDVKIFKKFRQLCGRVGLLPASHIIPENLIQTTEHPVASSSFGDVWEGIYNDKRVAIKALRVYKENDVRKVRKIFCKEVVMWRRISHPNIVPFLGVSESHAPLCMVSEWMPNGNVRDYVGKNPEISRLQLLLDISRGLSFLHSKDIVHGDLKGDNILVDMSGCARLNDFGLTSIADLNCMETSTSEFEATQRWMAPELFRINDEGKSNLSTRGSDVFALAMVTFEVFTGQVPFAEYKTSAMVMKSIVDDERPQRPPKGKKLGLSDEFWEIIRSSLAQEVEKRPPVETFVEFLEKTTPDIAVLKGLAEFDANSEVDIQQLRHIFEYGDNALLGMREAETLVLIEVFDRVLSSSLNDGTLRSQCLRGLQKVSVRCGLLPKSYWISYSSLAEPHDGSSPTRKVSRTHQRSIDGRLAAVKMVSLDRIENFSAFKHRLCTNAVMWKRLRHPNVVNFLGFGSDYPPFSLVYPWMSNGNLSDYMREHPDTDKLGLLLGVARGLTYLHQYDLVHGNLTGRNVLVDSDGVARISEYGLGLTLRDEVSKSIPTNARWLAPEVLTAEKEDKRVRSVDDGKCADVYSFGVVMFEVLSGTSPFPGDSDEEVIGKVTTGLRPEWPHGDTSQGLIDVLWEQIEACWSHGPEERPTAPMVLQALETLGEERPRGSQELLEHPDYYTWDPSSTTLVDMHSTLSGSTPTNSSIGHLFALPHHSGSSISKYGAKGRRTRVKRRVHYLLQLSGHGSVMAGAVEKRKPETVLVDQHEETIHVSDGSVSYLISKPIPPGKKLREVVVTIVSKDQGWSSYPEDHGTYRNSWTWFELSIGSSSEAPAEKWRGEVVRNLHAHGELKEHTIKISDKGLYEKAESGDVLTVWAHARFLGWRNTVKQVKIRYVLE